MLGSVGFNLAYVLMSTANNYCLHRLDVALRGLGVGPDVASILGVHTANTASVNATHYTPSSVIISTPTSISTSISTSTSTSTFISTSTSISTSTLMSTSTSTATLTSTSSSTLTSISTLTSTSTLTSASTSTSIVIPVTTSTAVSSTSTSTSTVTSTTYVVDSKTAAFESSATIEPSTPEPAKESKYSKAVESEETIIKSQANLRPSALEPSQESKSSKAVESKETTIESQATLEFPAPSGLPTSRSEPSDSFDWESIYEHGKGQKTPFNLTSRTELEDLQWTTVELLGLRDELRYIAKTTSRSAAAQVNGLGEVLAFVAITPLQEMSKIVMELQVRFVIYNANKPSRASDSIQMGPFIKDALERLERTKPEVEGLSPSGKQAYQHLTKFDPADRKYCFGGNCEWRARVLSRWRDVSQKRNLLKARLAEVDKELIAADETEWQTVLWALKTFVRTLPVYAGLLILGSLCARGWPVYPRQWRRNRQRAAGGVAPALAAPAGPGAPEPGAP
ncbi:hypothetical protein EV127DRAFT_503410 [Xylaria flabelliformis]|nr:hypothetical protein EV127DRAFT_503410 [Xylaria flabelliformis]